MERLLPNSVEAWHSPTFNWFLGGSVGSKENDHDTSTWIFTSIPYFSTSGPPPASKSLG